MTNEYEPDAIVGAFQRLAHARPDWHLALGGILGDEGHKYGYHRSRNWCARWSSWTPKPDYSIRRPDDRAGDGDAASALDITPQGDNAPEVMRVMTSRLIDAIDAGDPRAPYIAEVYGTRNNVSVVGRLYGSPASSDATHLWHVHVAGRRRYVDDVHAWTMIVDVILGEPYTYPPDHPRWSDTVTRDEIVKLVREETRDALQAVEFGGAHGAWTEKFAEQLVVPVDAGDRDRLRRLEARVDDLEELT